MGLVDMMDYENSCPTDITEDEAELYDRQLRLWGLDSQKRLRQSDILLAGLGGLGLEVAKNITLAGVKSITLIDERDIHSQMYTADCLAGDNERRNRAETFEASIHQLNPNVRVVADSTNIKEKTEDFFTQFDVICVTDSSVDVLFKLNRLCRKLEKKFFCGDIWGIYGFCFVDLGIESYVHETYSTEGGEPAAKRRCPSKRMETMEFGSLEKALSCRIGKPGIGLSKKTSKTFFLTHIQLEFRARYNRYPDPAKRQEDLPILKSLRQNIIENLGFDASRISDEVLSNSFGEISATCAVVGGVLANQIIKSVGVDDIPIQNFFLFDGALCSGVVENVGGN